MEVTQKAKSLGNKINDNFTKEKQIKYKINNYLTERSLYLDIKYSLMFKTSLY